MKKLIAKRPVLYLGRMYDKGDTLPANDQKMVTAWLNAKSAAWDGQEAKESRQEAQESAKQADGSQDSRGQNWRPRKTARERKWWRATWTLTSWPP